MTAKRILYVHASNELYGSDMVLLELIKRLDRSKFEPIVVLPTDIPYEGRLSDALAELGVKVHAFRYGVVRRRYFNLAGLFLYLLYLVLGVIRISALVRRYNVSLIHSSTSAVIEGAIVAPIMRRHHLWHIHEILVKPAFLSRILYALMLPSTRVIAVSQAVAEHVQRVKQRVSIQVIRNGIDTERFSSEDTERSLRTRWHVAETDVLVGMVGRISHLKGQEVFINAAAEAHQAFSGQRFLIVGDPVQGDENRLIALKSQAEVLGVGEQIIWMPYTPEIPAIMRALDILVVPSVLPESSGLVALEAMASGRPVIAAAHGGVVEIVQAGETGLLSVPGDAHDLAQAMIKLARDPELREALGRNARQQVVKRFSAQRFADEFNALYSTMLD